jgi:hypothetical protein
MGSPFGVREEPSKCTVVSDNASMLLQTGAQVALATNERHEETFNEFLVF